MFVFLGGPSLKAQGIGLARLMKLIGGGRGSMVNGPGGFPSLPPSKALL